VHTSLSGIGCELLPDLEPLVEHCQATGGKLKRCDIAADYTSGAVTMEKVAQAYHAGLFCRGGRPPKAQWIGPLQPNGWEGSTLYVGDRSSDVFARFYERGKMFLAELAHEIGSDADYCMVEVDGQRVDPLQWVRGEVELKAGKRFLSFDIVLNRDAYYAGAYPYLAQLLPDACPELLLAFFRAGAIELEVALGNIKR
jgi:phage replication initiation protein